MLNRKIYSLVILLSLISGCATTSTTIPSTWVGSNQRELIEVWGQPSKILLNERENQVLMFHYSKAKYSPSPFPSSGIPNLASGMDFEKGIHKNHAGNLDIYSCAIFFEVETGFKIIAWDWKGAACSRIISGRYKMVK